MRKEKSKCDLITEIEAMSKGHYENCNDLSNITLIIDVMLKCRQLKWKNLKTFHDFVTFFVIQ